MKLKYSRSKKPIHCHGDVVPIYELAPGEQFIFDLQSFKRKNRNPKDYVAVYQIKGNNIEYRYSHHSKWSKYYTGYKPYFHDRLVYVWNK
jgi:hypothetical protein